MTPDPKAYQYLENELSETSLSVRNIKDIAVNLMMRQVYDDDVKQLTEQVKQLQRQLRERTAAESNLLSTDSDSTGSAQSSARGRVTKTMTTQHGELAAILNEKDEIIRRKDTEYSKLRGILEDTQNDLHAILELNNQYLTIIGQLNQMTGVPPRNSEGSAALDDLEQRLENAQRQVKELEEELGGITEELDTTEQELEEALSRQMKYKCLLDLDPNASDDLIEGRLKELKEEGSLHKNELDKIQKSLDRSSKQCAELERSVTSLTREKERISFHMRQQELTIKKMQRLRTASSTIKTAESVLCAGNHVPTHLRLPSIDRPESQIGLRSNRLRLNQYCMFCRQEYQPMKSSFCRAHFRPIRQGKWTCCNGDSHSGIGCLQMPHLYMEMTVDKKLFITDGARYMEVS